MNHLAVQVFLASADAQLPSTSSTKNKKQVPSVITSKDFWPGSPSQSKINKSLHRDRTIYADSIELFLFAQKKLSSVGQICVQSTDQHHWARWCQPYTFRSPFNIVNRLHATVAAQKVHWTCVLICRTICMERTARSFACRGWPSWVPNSWKLTFYCSP